MSILEGLNPEQMVAATHVKGPLLVVAGAGTGKTQVITRRIAQLIASGEAKPAEILALTFTEKAAREMGDRLHGLIGWDSFQVQLMTFNAFGAELLGRYASHVGRSVRGGLLNDTQKTLLLQRHFGELELEYYGPQADLYEFVERIVQYIGKLQNAAVTPERYRAYVDGLGERLANGAPAGEGEKPLHPSDVAEQRDLAAMYELYEKVKRDSGTYDYHDQLALPLLILQQRSNLVERLAREYKFVLVDEYQDTSPIQDELLRSFVARDGNIFAVGDDDQAIYSFRGADIDNILSFTEHFDVASPTALIRNYRSGQPILDAAYRLIRHNDPERLETKLALNKRLVALDDRAEVTFVPYASPAEEQAAVAEAIAARVAAGESPATMAVLARSNAALKAFAKALTLRSVPFAMSTEVDIFSQREVINLWYLMRWLGEMADDDSIAHVMLGPYVGWTPAEYRQVTQRAKREMVSAEEALRLMAAEGDGAAGGAGVAEAGAERRPGSEFDAALGLAELVETVHGAGDGVADGGEASEASGPNAASALVMMLDRWRGWAREVPVSQLAYKLVFETGVKDRLIADGVEQPRVVRVFEDLQRLLTQMQDYETVAGDVTLAGYLTTFPKPPKLETGELVGEAEGVQLLTVHASKGLEFETVYVVNCTHKSWSERAASGLVVPEQLQSASGMPPEHEQRRLMYVAATRAKRTLCLSAPVASAGGQAQAVSPLIAELLEDEVPKLAAVPKVGKQEKLMQRLQRFYPLKEEAEGKRLPYETSDGWIELGVGALESYDRCPYDFYLQYGLGIREPFGVSMAFGSVVHAAIEAYYQAQLRGEVAELPELLARVDELWQDHGYPSKAAAEADHEKARETVRWVVAREERLRQSDAPERAIVASEQKVTLELPEAKLRLRGRIDAYYQTPAGIEIRDFKTGRTKTDAEKLADEAKKHFQLRTYALAYEVMQGKAPARVTLDYVVTHVEGSAELSGRILANHRAKLVELAERIRLRDFAPAPPSEYHKCAAVRFYGDAEDEEMV